MIKFFIILLFLSTLMQIGFIQYLVLIDRRDEDTLGKLLGLAGMTFGLLATILFCCAVGGIL